MQNEFRLIDAHYRVVVLCDVLTEKPLPKIKVEKVFGKNELFDDLRRSDIYEYHNMGDNVSGYEGDMAASIEYESKKYGLCLLRFVTDNDSEGVGIVESSIPQNDCMLFKHNYKTSLMCL